MVAFGSGGSKSKSKDVPTSPSLPQLLRFFFFLFFVFFIFSVFFLDLAKVFATYDKNFREEMEFIEIVCLCVIKVIILTLLFI
jgi:hypothetical protein